MKTNEEAKEVPVAERLDRLERAMVVLVEAIESLANLVEINMTEVKAAKTSMKYRNLDQEKHYGN